MTLFELMYCDSENMTHFSVFILQISRSKNHDTKVQCSFLFLNRETFFSTAVKNNFNITGIDKSRTYECYVLKIINFTNCRT